MRILMTVDAVGGVWSYALTLCASLEMHGIDVTLACLGPRPSEAQRLAAAKLGNVRLFTSDHRLEWMPDGWRDQEAAGHWLMNLADDEAADIVHLNGYSLAALAWRRPAVCVAHSCVSSWWRAVHGVSPPPEWTAYRRGVTRGLNSADRVVAPTNAFLAQLYSCYDLRRPAQVIHNGIMHEQDSASERPRLPIVFACGRPWDAAKNMGVLDAAAEGVTWRVYLAGNLAGPDGSCFSSASLRMLGSLSNDDVMSWLRRASIFVHPALYEPFGLAVVEAAASGCALVLADIPTLRELWDGAAEFFDPRDARHLAATLDALIADPERRRELGSAASARAARYSAHAMTDAYRALYEGLLDETSNARAHRPTPRGARHLVQEAQA
jgi:glycosyltransferase involved in cell wall biosynthesis